MHRDKKLGLALAVMIIGFACAFCFRTENEDLPRLEDVAELDEQIAEKSLIPYLTGVEAIEEPQSVSSNRSSRQIQQPPAWHFTSSSTSTNDWSTSSSDSWDIAGAAAGDNSDFGSMPSAATPEPIIPLPREDETADFGSPAIDEQAWLADDSWGADSSWTDDTSSMADNSWESSNDGWSTGITEPPLDKNSTADEYIIHRVESGDTLTGISSKYLGDGRRFMEIYQLNQDILSSPDALRIGMKLRVPANGKTSQTATRPQTRDLASRLFEEERRESENLEDKASVPSSTEFDSWDSWDSSSQLNDGFTNPAKSALGEPAKASAPSPTQVSETKPSESSKPPKTSGFKMLHQAIEGFTRQIQQSQLNPIERR